MWCCNYKCWHFYRCADALSNYNDSWRVKQIHLIFIYHYLGALGTTLLPFHCKRTRNKEAFKVTAHVVPGEDSSLHIHNFIKNCNRQHCLCSQTFNCKIQGKALTASVLWPILENCPFLLIYTKCNGIHNIIMHSTAAYLHCDWIQSDQAIFPCYSFPAMGACLSCLLAV